jgi:hypothetical protein
VTGTCSASPCTISGLVAGQSYTFTMAAKLGDGDATSTNLSAASVSVAGGAAASVTEVTTAATTDGVRVSFTAPPAATGSDYRYTITNDVDADRVSCAASPCIVVPSSTGTRRYSVTNYDAGRNQISRPAASSTTIKAAVFGPGSDTKWTIPSGASQLTVIVTGGGGGGGGNAARENPTGSGQDSQGGGAGGAGATISWQTNVWSAQTELSIVTGAGGSRGTVPLMPGGGGGASGICVNGNAVVIAAGGGGGGYQNNPVLVANAGASATTSFGNAPLALGSDTCSTKIAQQSGTAGRSYVDTSAGPTVGAAGRAGSNLLPTTGVTGRDARNGGSGGAAGTGGSVVIFH